MIAAVRAATDRPFNVNVFCNRPAVADRSREAAWLARLAPVFRRFGAEPPARLTEIYRSFVEDDAMLAVLLEERPRVVSFHFGLPPAERIAALRDAGIVLLATATNLEEARSIAAAGSTRWSRKASKRADIGACSIPRRTTIASARSP